MTGFKPEAFDCDNAAQNIFLFFTEKDKQLFDYVRKLGLECSIKHTKICKKIISLARLHLARELRKMVIANIF